MEKNFEIGQVVYILSEQAQTILPGIVAEEVVIKKLTGNTTSWKVKVGDGDKAKLFDSAKIKGEVYGSLDEVRQVMTKRLNEFIDKLTGEAEMRVEKWYGKEIAARQKLAETNPTISTSGTDDRIDPDILLSTLENNPNPGPKFTKEGLSGSPKANLRAHLERLAVPEEDDESLSRDGAVFITGPNGERIPVNMPKPKVLPS